MAASRFGIRFVVCVWGLPICLGVLDFPCPGGSGTLKLLSGEWVLPRLPVLQCTGLVACRIGTARQVSGLDTSLVDITPFTGLAMPVIGVRVLCLRVREPWWDGVLNPPAKHHGKTWKWDLSKHENSENEA